MLTGICLCSYDIWLDSLCSSVLIHLSFAYFWLHLPQQPVSIVSQNLLILYCWIKVFCNNDKSNSRDIHFIKEGWPNQCHRVSKDPTEYTYIRRCFILHCGTLAPNCMYFIPRNRQLQPQVHFIWNWFVKCEMLWWFI